VPLYVLKTSLSDEHITDLARTTPYSFACWPNQRISDWQTDMPEDAKARVTAATTLDARPLAFDYPYTVGRGGNAMTKSIAIAVVCCLAILVAADRSAFAQAGSTGGTLGKTDKSASGGEEGRSQTERKRVTTRSEPRNATERSCSTIVGTWRWFTAFQNGDVVIFKADGSGLNASKNNEPGKWTCSGGEYVLTWSAAGNVDHVRVLGNDLTGTGVVGAITAHRE
jgi:hypothetical protein